MKQTAHIIFFLLLTCLAFSSRGQQRIAPEKAGSFRDGLFTISFDLRWDKNQQQAVTSLFELDTFLIKALLRRDFRFVNDSTEWYVTRHQGDVVEISKEIGSKQSEGPQRILLTDQPLDSGSYRAWVEPPPYGVNDFSSREAFWYKDSTACFVLPGYAHASKVFLSGTFNNWSTMELPMERIATGWQACIQLAPGKYLYKFIVDGRWMTDPNNRQSEGLHRWNQNSVVFCYNHTFQLNAFENAGRVFVAGSFNAWRRQELKMEKTSKGWELPLFLREGTHAYKFVVDRRWLLDPDNAVTRPDGRGNHNSFLGIGDTLYFSLEGFQKAENVYVAGNFNLWNEKELAMQKTASGWQLPYVLAAGNYEYKFIVDGNWITDPVNPYTTGRGAYTNSFLTVKPSHSFVLKGFKDARQVIVTGSFNGWRHTEYQMMKVDEGWIFPLWLRPGRYSYKFIVDGQWITDPANALVETNEFGGENSVLWIQF